jgi:transcriptional/translational regulatory protein YebC/TACO1
MAPTSYLFERKGQISLEATSSNPSPTLESLFDTTLSHDLNIEDIRPTNSEVDDVVEFELITPLGELQDIALKFNQSPLSDDWALKGSDMVYEPVVGVEVLEGDGEGEGIREEKVEGLFKLIDALEIEQDITQVWTNLAK